VKLNIRAGDAVIVAGRPLKIAQISELDFEEKSKARIPPSAMARRLTLSDKTELVFLS